MIVLQHFTCYKALPFAHYERQHSESFVWPRLIFTLRSEEVGRNHVHSKAGPASQYKSPIHSKSMDQLYKI